MIKKLLGWWLQKLMARLDQHVDEQSIHAYVMKHYTFLSQLTVTEKSLDQDLTHLEDLLIKLEWIDSGAKRQVSEQTQERKDWQGYNWLAEGDCFSRNGVEPGCGQFLDWMEENSDPDDQRMVAENLEKLLWHVEVKREKALRTFSREISMEQQCLERCDISILFSRTALRRHDLRFLNAALKMNEWFMNELGQTGSNQYTTRLLIALAEQELSARELLAC
jgi:hypothetical protein